MPVVAADESTTERYASSSEVRAESERAADVASIWARAKRPFTLDDIVKPNGLRFRATDLSFIEWAADLGYREGEAVRC